MDRRRFLTTAVTTGSAIFAGCAGSSTSESDDSDRSNEGTETKSDKKTTTAGGVAKRSDTIASTSFEKGSLQIALAENADVDLLRLISPEGEVHSEADTPTGATAATFTILGAGPFGKDYTAGEYTIVAVKDEQEVESRTITLQPELELTAAAHNPKAGNLHVTIRNTGSGPVRLTAIAMAGASESLDKEMERESEPVRVVDGERKGRNSYILAPDEKAVFTDGLGAVKFASYNVDEPYCDGSGPFGRAIPIAVKSPSLGWVSAEVSGELTGETTYPSPNFVSCESFKSSGFPIAFSPVE